MPAPGYDLAPGNNDRAAARREIVDDVFQFGLNFFLDFLFSYPGRRLFNYVDYTYYI